MTDTMKRLAQFQPPHTAASSWDPSVNSFVRRATLTNRGAQQSYVKLIMRDSNSYPIVQCLLDPWETRYVPIDAYVSATSQAIWSQQITDMTDRQVDVTSMASVGSGTDTTAYTTGSWASVAGGVYLLSVTNVHGSNAASPSGFTDTHSGLTWTLLNSVQSTDLTVRTSMYRATTSGVTSTTTQVTFAANQTSACVSVVRANGADSGGTQGERGIISAGTFASRTMTTGAYMKADDWSGFRFVAMGWAGNFSNHTPYTGWTEIHDLNASEASGAQLATVYNPTPGLGYAGTLSSATAGKTAVCMASVQDDTYPVTVMLDGVEIT